MFLSVTAVSVSEGCTQEETDQGTCHISAPMTQVLLILRVREAFFGTAGPAPPLLPITEVGCATEKHMDSL